MTRFFIVAFLVLHFFQGNAEIRGEDEMMEFVYEYTAYFGDYYNTTGDYYSDNNTINPTMYAFYEIQESVGSQLWCHQPLILLFSLLGFLL